MIIARWDPRGLLAPRPANTSPAMAASSAESAWLFAWTKLARLDLPVGQPTKFELAVDLKTERARGRKISESFLLRADTAID